MEGSPVPNRSRVVELPDDEEVLERVSRLEPVHTYDRNIVLSNFEVLKRLRDDAVAFGADR